MAVILKPASGDDLIINWWNWRPTVAMMVRQGILPAGEREERCLANGCGGHFTTDEALAAADYLDALIAKMNPIQRVLFDGEITSKLHDFNKPISEWDDADTYDAYSVQYEVLKKLALFCRCSGGFEVV